jgi:hypothetical protein
VLQGKASTTSFAADSRRKTLKTLKMLCPVSILDSPGEAFALASEPITSKSEN